MKVRSNVETQSSLPEFVLLSRTWEMDWDTQSQYPMVEVQCTRPNCQGIFKVDEEHWRETVHSVIKLDIVIIGRSCPYCSAVSRVPEGAA